MNFLPAMPLGNTMKMIIKMKKTPEEILKDEVSEYIKTELPESNVPFHYEAEAAFALKDFLKWIIKRKKLK